MMMELNRWYLVVLALAAVTLYGADACSCMKSHPQSHFCQSDFVIVATVRRLTMLPMRSENVYKLKIRNELKMSEKAKVALKSGRLVTDSHESLCGVHLDVNTTYLITGRIVSLTAHVNLCNYVKPWKLVTNRQRKGFRKLYKQGCQCKIQSTRSVEKQSHVCEWNPWNKNNCHNDYGICLINKDGHCNWARAPLMTHCLRNSEGTPLRKTWHHERV